jgi:threonine synthase
MQLIYDNMTKLFDVFTKGALAEQGANSEILLRQVYRSLDENFLKIVQDTDVVNKIAEVMKQRQDNVDPASADTALVSETTKKVVTKTLEPDNIDLMQVVLDFMDELQTSILQVKLSLSREYDKQKIAYANSLKGQQEDLDNLNQEFQNQSEEMAESMEILQSSTKEQVE